MRTEAQKNERALIRTIAGASRRLDEDLKLSDLQAIDRLQKLDDKFRSLWWKHPFLVLEDGYAIPAHMPVHTMLAEIGAHGQPIGMVGVAVLSTQRWTVFKQMFRKDEKSRKLVENSATLAGSLFEDSLRSPYSGKVFTDGKTVSIFYSWEQHDAPEAGWQLAGVFDLIQKEDGTFELKIQTYAKWKHVMEQAKERFAPHMNEIAKLLSSTKKK